MVVHWWFRRFIRDPWGSWWGPKPRHYPFFGMYKMGLYFRGYNGVANPKKWPNKWLIGVTTPTSGVSTPTLLVSLERAHCVSQMFLDRTKAYRHEELDALCTFGLRPKRCQRLSLSRATESWWNGDLSSWFSMQSRFWNKYFNIQHIHFAMFPRT